MRRIDCYLLSCEPPRQHSLHVQRCVSRYDDDSLQQADPNVAHKPLSDVRADVASGGSSASGSMTRATTDPEEDMDTSTAEVAEFMAKVGAQHLHAPTSENSPTFLDALLAVGEYTTLVDLVYGHEDHFGIKAGQLIENKMTLHRGSAVPDLHMSQLPSIGDVPPGALALVRYKVATIVCSMQDVELHELHEVVHTGSGAGQYSSDKKASDSDHEAVFSPMATCSQRSKKRKRRAERTDAVRNLRNTRGCWRRVSDSRAGIFYPNGVALTDWASRFYPGQ